ncbi:MAG: S8 family serine peptidase [Nocardioidaceae bacterium]
MRSGARVALVVVVSAALVFPALSVSADAAGSGSSGSGSSGEARFTKVHQDAKVTGVPIGLGNKTATFVVQVSGEPVAVADANSSLTDSQQRAHRQRLLDKQAPIASEVRSLGGKVMASYQSSYNGIKVRMTRRQAQKLTSVPGVVAVRYVRPMTLDNTRGVPLIGAPKVWNGLNGLHGERVKVAILDTGIDYTHADFGGPGTSEAYETAHADETGAANSKWFGPKAPKVKGGIDLVGDSYDADPSSDTYQPTPHPDANPLDCEGHGTHVAGTAAGFGVTASGHTYQGPYKANTISSRDWNVGPGVAPKADLYAVRLFGCTGSTDMTIDAIEWAVKHHMDVINMSLGSVWGDNHDPAAVAANNAAKAGIIVVASAGNEGPNPYLVGSPSTGTRVISVAASDATASFPGAELALSTGTSVDAMNANGADLPTGDLPVKVLSDGAGGIGLGCDLADYAGTEGMVVVTVRGSCARVARAVFGQQAGAAAVVMVNTSEDLPPYEGPITENPDTGEQQDVTIPFLGVKQSSGDALTAADGGTVTLSAADITNPNYLGNADFSSGGARTGDSALKPNVSAPGVAVASAGIGTGTDAVFESGTSMASPNTAGMAALVRQAHRGWSSKAQSAAISNTADPAKVTNYQTRIAGVGLIQAPGATKTSVVATAADSSPAVSFGFAELTGDYRQSRVITLRNFGKRSVTFKASTVRPSGSKHSVRLNRTTVRVPAHGTARVRLTLTVRAVKAGDSSAFNDVAGLVRFAPRWKANSGVTLRVPYYLVPQAVSKIKVALDTDQLAYDASGTATVTNRGGVVAGSTDWYEWGLTDPQEDGGGSSDVIAVGAQTFPDDGVLAFGVATARRWSNPSQNEIDIFVDVDGDGEDDYDVVAIDYGWLTAGDPDGQTAVAVFDLATGDGSINYLADAPFDSSTMALPVDFDQLCTTETACLSEDDPRLTYHVESYGQSGDEVITDVVDGNATFNAFAPAVSTGMYDTVEPDGTASVDVSVNRPEFKKYRPLGFLVLSHDNASKTEATLLRVRLAAS